MYKLFLLSGFLLTLLTSHLSFAVETLMAKKIQIDWLVPQTFSENAETLVGIRFRPDRHWHVYWKNPGDSGAAPKFRIQAKNAEAGEILWPYPVRLPIAHLTNFGYDKEVVYFFKVKTNTQSPVELEANLEWLVCQEECIPGFGKLTLSRPVSGKESQFEKSVQSKLQFYQKRLPTDGHTSPYVMELSELSGEALKLTVSSSTAQPKQIDVFPVDPEFINPAQPKISKVGSSYEVIFKKSSTAPKPSRLGFVLVADEKPYEFLDVVFVSSAIPTEAASGTILLVLLASALLGGILLNLMPCVFPVVSIKAVSLLKNNNSRERRRDGIHYTLGVLTTFTCLGVGFLILRNLGSAVGWGFQLQSPLVVFSLILLFWFMALNFLGVFEFGSRIMNSTGKIRWQSSFGTGVLSVFIAAPCTGPFMGTALGATATMPGYQAVLVFLFMGLGLALPYLALTLSDGLARRMPKPGAWMETLKQFFAFPLFATVLWLLWVLGQQSGTEGWVATGIALLGTSFALWLGQRRKKFWYFAAWLVALLTIFYSAQQIQTAQAPNLEFSNQNVWQSYSEEKLNAALQKNQPVFIDFTAAWCITCQVNKKLVLETSEASEIFERLGILRLKADWTKQDPLITQALARLERNSVPVYAFYSGKDSKPRLLPQILTIDMIQNLIPSKEEK